MSSASGPDRPVNSATWEELLGDITPDPEATARFLRLWHGGAVGSGGQDWGRGLVGFTALPSAVNKCRTVDAMVQTVNSQGLNELVFTGQDDRALAKGQNLYHAAAILGRPPRGRSRGKKADFAGSPGCWVDLDCKPGAFENWKQILDVVQKAESAGIPPAILISSGSGGAHLYWRIEGGLAPKQTEIFNQRIESWIRETTGKKVDGTHEITRLMRTPGGIRWPKSGGKDTARGSTPQPVEMLRADDRWTALEDIVEVTEGAWSRVAERRSAARTEIQASTASFQEFLRDVHFESAEGYSRDYMIAHADELFAERHTWDEILAPKGWTLYAGPDSEGRREWTRPGEGKKNPRSLVTDWIGSPHVASLVSEAEETGLLRLKNAGVALTKARVYAELYWREKGGYSALMVAFLTSKGLLS